jgi:hypothetical protein
MKSSHQDEIKINGRVIPLKSTKLRESFTALTKIKSEIEELKASVSDNNRLISIQLRLVNMLDEIVLLITKEKKEEQLRSDTSGSLYNTLLAHVKHLKLSNSKERNLL